MVWEFGPRFHMDSLSSVPSYCDFMITYVYIQLPFGPAATVPWTLGPGSRQTDNQQTRKPARQRANIPRNQQTNKPTRQQTNTTTSNKSRDEPPNQPKNNQKINQKSTKMAPKSVLEAVLGASWGFLGRLGPILAPRRPQQSKIHGNSNSGFPSWGPTWESKYIENRFK